LDDRYIVESNEFYVFNIGASEYIVDGNDDFLIVGGATVVYKADGTIGSLPSSIVAIDPTIRSHPNPNPMLDV
jgi:hypothetical protein